MIATTPTIHKSVVFLLKKQGYGALEAERLWDDVYSKQFRQAKPNVQHRWLIGEYTLEFTKRTQDTEPIEIVADPDTGRGKGAIVLVFVGGLVSLIAALIAIF